MTLMEFFGFTQRFFEELLAPTPQPAKPAAAQGPSDPVQALTLADGVRDIRLETEHDHIELGGTVMARTQAVMDAVGQDDYGGARAALQTLRDDVDTERQQRDSLQQQYDADKQALESGALAAFPPAPPQGLAGLHSRIAQARALLPAAPKTLAEYTQATQALATLDAAVKGFQQAEQQQLAAARQAYLSRLARLESGDLKKLPVQCPDPSLAQFHDAATQTRAALPANPQTLAELGPATQTLEALERRVERYLRQEEKLLPNEQRRYTGELSRIVNNLPKIGHSLTTALLERVRELEAKLPSKLGSLAERDAAFALLADMRKAADAFFAAENKLRDERRKEFGKVNAALIQAGIQSLPGYAPPGLEKEHAELKRIDRARPSGMFWSTEYEAHIAHTQQMLVAMEAFNKAEALLLPPVREQLANERKAVYEGPLAQIPDAPIKQLKSAHQAVQKARALFESVKPQTLDQHRSALNHLGRLKESVERYLALGPEMLAQEQAKFQQAKAALEQGDLAKVADTVDTVDAELAKAHAGLMRARKSLNQHPQTFDEIDAATKTLENLASWVAHYTKIRNGAQNAERGVAGFGPGGTRLAEVPGYESFNSQQLAYFNDTLPRELKQRNTKAYSDAELLDYAKSLGGYIAKLAETPVESSFPGINAALAKSETLKTAVVQLQAKGWKIMAGKPGGGSYCSRGRECIVLDPEDNRPEDVLAGLAHEAGHAQFTPPQTPKTHQAASGIEFVTKGLESGFIDEGQAQMVACKVQKEMAKAGQPFRVPGGAQFFIAIYDRFLAGELSEDDARKEMGRKFNELKASGSGQLYKVQYGRPIIDAWNAAQLRDNTKLSYDVLDTLVVFG